MMANPFKNDRNYDPSVGLTSHTYENPNTGELEDGFGPSLTMPDEGISALDIMKKLEQNYQLPPVYDFFDDIPQPQFSDRIERLQHAMNVRERIKDVIPRQQGETQEDYVRRILTEKRKQQLQAEQAEAIAAAEGKNPPTDPPAGQPSEPSA